MLRTCCNVFRCVCHCTWLVCFLLLTVSFIPFNVTLVAFETLLNSVLHVVFPFFGTSLHRGRSLCFSLARCIFDCVERKKTNCALTRAAAECAPMENSTRLHNGAIGLGAQEDDHCGAEEKTRWRGSMPNCGKHQNGDRDERASCLRFTSVCVSPA